MKIPESVRALVASGPYAHLTTLNPDGGPQVTVVWIGVDGDELVMAHLGEWKKVQNVRRDPRVAVSMLGPTLNPQGLREYVVAYGRVRVTEGGALDLLERLAPVYLGPKADFPPPQYRTLSGFVTHLAPARITGVGPWARPH